MIHQSIRTMLQTINNATIPDANIVYGTRNQFQSFPTITYTITEHETLTIGASPLKRCMVTIKSVQQEAHEALTLAAAVEAKLLPSTYSGVEFCSVLNKNTILEEPSNGYGEETNPFVAITTAQIYYKG
jgi:hypothetical protein